MFSFLQNDDLDGIFQIIQQLNYIYNKNAKPFMWLLYFNYSYSISLSPTFDITKEHKLKKYGYYYYLFDSSSSISLIDFCCFFGSLKCFKYLLLNKCEITEFTLKYSIAGGNQEIINILKENGHSFEECLETSVKYMHLVL